MSTLLERKALADLGRYERQKRCGRRPLRASDREPDQNVENQMDLAKNVSGVKPKAPPDPRWLQARDLADELQRKHDAALHETRQHVWDVLGERDSGSFCRPLFAGEYAIANLGVNTPAFIVGRVESHQYPFAVGGKVVCGENFTFTVYVVACSEWLNCVLRKAVISVLMCSCN